MCRHLAYVGTPVPLGSLLMDPPHGLLRQSYAPRRQRQGIINADGFGVGWYADDDPVPARYRRDKPMWTDANLADLTRVVQSRAVLAAVRSGTAGMGHSEGAVAPFRSGRWLFSHNGVVPGWPASGQALAASVPAAVLMSLDAPTDAAMLWAATLHRLEAGQPLAEALAETVRSAAVDGARLNLLATDGTQIAATAWGDTLCWRTLSGGVVVASEPFDDEPGWQDVTDRSLLVVTPDGIRIESLVENS